MLIVLIITLNGCTQKSSVGSGIKIPSFSEKRLDPNLPTIKNLKFKTSMSKVALEWQPVLDKNIAGYRIFRKGNRGSYKLIATIKDRYRSHFVDKNLDPNINYTYMVSLFTYDGRVSRTSLAKNAKTEKKLFAPILVDVSKDYPNRIKLLWKPHTNEAVKSYIIQRKGVKSLEWKKIATIKDRLSAEYIDKSIEPGKVYSYRIFAKSFDGVISPPSKELKGNSKKLPNPILHVQATTNLAKKINIIWKRANRPDNISHYNIYSSPMQNTLFSYLGSSKEPKYTDKFETDGNKRYYKVTAVDHDGLESPKGATSVLGKTIGASRGPIIVLATVKKNAVYLKWKDPDGKARKYTVVKKYWDGWRAKKVKIVDFKSTSFTDKKIKPDTKYTYYVISVDKHGIESLPSKEVILAIEPK